jgi:hypothetical protein
MLTVIIIVLLGAFVTCIASAMGKCPLWIPVVLLCIVGLLEHLPLGK